MFAAVGAETTLEKNGGPLLLSLATEANRIGRVTDEEDGQHEEKHEEEHVDAPGIGEKSDKAVQQEKVKKSKEEKKGSRFGKIFKIKPHLKNVPQEESAGESPAGLSPPEAEPQQVSASLLLFLTPTMK